MPDPAPRGLFAGLATLDVIHRVDAQPSANEKITANAQFVAAGGPAANAAVTFAALGGRATLVTALGSGFVASAIAAELAEAGVEVVDLAPDLRDAAPVSSVSVIEETGDRAVIGGDAAGLVVPAPGDAVLDAALEGASVVLIDGHHPALARAVARAAHDREIPAVLDAGRWKPVMPDLLPLVTDAVASADFRVPGAADSAETGRRLAADGVPVVVVTAGGAPVRWWCDEADGSVDVPRIETRDTLGAGDVFHGAYAYARAEGIGLEQRLGFASEVAATRCGIVGPRAWLDAVARIPLPG